MNLCSRFSAFNDITKSINLPLVMAGLSGGLGVSFGALGAHAFLPLMDLSELKSYQVANQHHLVYTVVMMLVAAAVPHASSETASHLRRVYALFASGMVLVSIPQYILSTCHRPEWLRKLIGLGGLVLMSGWCYVAALGVLVPPLNGGKAN